MTNRKVDALGPPNCDSCDPTKMLAILLHLPCEDLGLDQQ